MTRVFREQTNGKSKDPVYSACSPDWALRRNAGEREQGLSGEVLEAGAEQVMDSQWIGLREPVPSYPLKGKCPRVWSCEWRGGRSICHWHTAF